MKTRSILTVPTSLQPLFIPAAPVKKISQETRTILDDMYDTLMKPERKGIGLAATQIGISKRLVVIDINREGFNTGRMNLINPEIIWHSEETRVYNEGCLSVPGENGLPRLIEVTRPAKVRVKYIDMLSGLEKIMEADGLLATCLQHEIDHLNGITILHYAKAPDTLPAVQETSPSSGKA